MKAIKDSSPLAHRLLLIADRHRLSDWLRQQYPTMEISEVPSFMAGIAELSNAPVHAIVADVDPASDVLDRGVAGLRHVVGEQVPVVLCCSPEAEPATRRAMDAGATDYVIFPPEPTELDRLLHLSSSRKQRHKQLLSVDLRETEALAKVLEAMTEAPQRMLEEMTRLIVVAFDAHWAKILTDGIEVSSGDQGHQAALQMPLLAGSEEVGQVYAGPLRDAGWTLEQTEKLRHYAGVFGYMIAAARKQHTWQRLAMTDDLTGLPNRRRLTQFLNQILQRASVEQLRVTVCFFDIDDFKQYNDRFGYAAGDRIIQATADLLQKHSRQDDLVARLGGDEFVVVFWDAEQPRISGSQHPSEALAVMQRFTEAIAEHEFPDLGPQGKGRLTISGGLASYPWDASTAEELLKRANDALRDAKNQGKDQIHLVGSPQGRSARET